MQAVEPIVGKSSLGKVRTALRARHRRRKDAAPLRLVAAVGLRRDVQVLVRDERDGRVDRAAPPARKRAARKIARALAPVGAQVAPAILLDRKAPRVELLVETVYKSTGLGAQRPLVANAAHGVGDIPAQGDKGVVCVAERVVVEVVVWLVRVVGKLRREKDARLVRRVKILRLFVVGMHAHVVEAGRLQHLEVCEVEVPVRRRNASRGIHEVVSAAPDVERLVVQVEVPAAHFELPHAEALKPRMDDLPVRRDKIDPCRVEVRMRG